MKKPFALVFLVFLSYLISTVNAYSPSLINPFENYYMIILPVIFIIGLFFASKVLSLKLETKSILIASILPVFLTYFFKPISEFFSKDYRSDTPLSTIGLVIGLVGQIVIINKLNKKISFMKSTGLCVLGYIFVFLVTIAMYFIVIAYNR